MTEEAVLIERIEEQAADTARVAAENAELWEEVQCLRRDNEDLRRECAAWRGK